MPTQHANIRNHQASPADPPRRILYAFLIATAFIVYASLYPFSFHPGSLIDAIHTMLRDHNMHDQPWSGLIANIAFYWPLGFFCTAAQNRSRPAWRRVCLAAILGLLLSLTMVTSQVFIAGRVSTLTVVLPNAVGALAGALLAVPTAHHLNRSGPMNSPVRQAATVLLLMFLAYRLYPYAPSIDLHDYWRALKPMVLHPQASAYSVASYVITWSVVAALLADVAGWLRSRWLIILAMAAVTCGQVVIVNNRLSLSELIALPIAIMLWQFLAS